MAMAVGSCAKAERESWLRRRMAERTAAILPVVLRTVELIAVCMVVPRVWRLEDVPANLKGYNAEEDLEDSRFSKYIFVAVWDENILWWCVKRELCTSVVPFPLGARSWLMNRFVSIWDER